MKRILYTGARSGIAINTINKIINEDYYLYLTVHTDKQLEYLQNKYKNNNKKGYCNYEQRDYDKEGFDWNSLYANNNFTL